MLKIITLTLGILSFSFNLSAEKCSTAVAKSNVQRICKIVKENGKKPAAADLFFENCGKNYVWIQDTDKNVSMVIHPVKSHLDGKPLDKVKDEKGDAIFVKFEIEAHKVAKKSKTKGGRTIDLTSKANRGWVDYMWPKINVDKATPKASYVELCEGPGGISWVAGSGIWKEDLM